VAIHKPRRVGINDGRWALARTPAPYGTAIVAGNTNDRKEFLDDVSEEQDQPTGSTPDCADETADRPVVRLRIGRGRLLMAQPPEHRRRQPTHTAQNPEYSHVHYLLIGLALAALWFLSRDKSLLFHAAQMLGVMGVLTGLQIVLRRRVGIVPAYTRLIVAKLVLVALAVGAEWVLARVTSQSNAIVAAGLVVLITAAGPPLDRLAVRRERARQLRARATFDQTLTRED